MCLGIPGRIIRTHADGDLQMASVEFGAIRRDVCIEYVPDVEVGDYVLVHVGFALSRIDEAEAKRVFALLEELGELVELSAGEPTR